MNNWEIYLVRSDGYFKLPCGGILYYLTITQQFSGQKPVIYSCKYRFWADVL